MISVLIANAKGGCGKTTVATNLATAFASAGLVTALADADRQRSSTAWLKRRPEAAAPIIGLDWRRSMDRPKKRIDRLVIDTGAGLRSSHVRELLKRSTLLVMPIQPSVWDERATARFLKDVDRLKPIRKGRKSIAIVGDRLRANTRSSVELDAFLDGLGHEVVARLYDRSIYQDVARKGLGVFDLSPSRRAEVIDDWLPLVETVESYG